MGWFQPGEGALGGDMASVIRQWSLEPSIPGIPRSRRAGAHGAEPGIEARSQGIQTPLQVIHLPAVQEPPPMSPAKPVPGLEMGAAGDANDPLGVAEAPASRAIRDFSSHDH